MPAAARLADEISHSNKLGGLIAGALIGGAIAVLVIGTGGIAAAPLMAGAAIAGAAVGGASLGEMLGSLSFAMEVTGAIAPVCSVTVFVNSRPAARAHLDFVECSHDSPGHPLIAQGSGTVSINGMPAARKGDHTVCDAEITQGSPTVFIGGPQVTTDEISPEVPGYVHGAMLAIGLASAIILAGPVVAMVGLAGGYVGGNVGSDVGGALFGAGSDGQKLMAFGGGLLGGALGGKGGAWFDRNYEIQSVGLGSNLGNVRIVPKTPAAAPKGPIQANEVTNFQDFKDRSVVGDNLEGHEVWQHANLKANDLATTRLSTDASKNNPVIALDHDTHVQVNAAQRALDPSTQTPIENINANTQILRDLNAAPPSQIDALHTMATDHAKSLGY